MFLPLGVFSLSQYIFGSLLFLLSTFIIGIILLQRGKGGGLTGALGGLGGQSAFGVKAGDLFTRITAVAVLIWIFVCALACRWYLPEDLDIVADPGSSTSISGLSNERSESPGLDLKTEPVPGLAPSANLPGDSSTLPPVPSPAIQNLPPQTPATNPEASNTENATTQPQASDPPTSPPPSEKQQ